MPPLFNGSEGMVSNYTRFSRHDDEDRSFPSLVYSLLLEFERVFKGCHVNIGT